MSRQATIGAHKGKECECKEGYGVKGTMQLWSGNYACCGKKGSAAVVGGVDQSSALACGSTVVRGGAAYR
jgi:hypothetical protein